jgi:hypothetical protein
VWGFPVLSKFFEHCLVFSLLLLSFERLSAVEPDTSSTVAKELKQLNDQTIIGNRMSLDSEWEQFKHGAGKATWTVAGLWGWPMSHWQDWGIRFRLPFAYRRSDPASDQPDLAGVGDFEIGAGTAFRLNHMWRTAGGIELHGDTASDRDLSESVWRLKPGWGIAHDFTDWLTLSFSADYNHSIIENDNVSPQSYLELSLPATFILPQAWSVNARYKATTDFKNGDRWTYTIYAGIAKRLSKVPIVLSATFGKPLSGGSKNFQASVTIVYYFQRYHSPK